MNKPQLSLALLGPFSATVGDTSITAFRTDKVRALLAYLALEPEQPHSRHALAGLLWPDLLERQSMDNVRVTLYRLRQTLDAAQPGLADQLFAITRQTVQLNVAAVWVDVADFEAASIPATTPRNAPLIAQLAQAVTLYRGELLAGFSLADAPTYEEWLLLRREQLAARALLALKTLADAFEAQGDLEQAHTYATRLLELDPYGEASRRQMMRILVQRGLPDQALAQYATLRRLLRDELGVEPNAQTVALYEQIRDGKGEAVTRWRGDSHLVTLPPPHPVTRSSAAFPHEIPFTGSFVGRADEVAALTRWLAPDAGAPRAQLVMVLGLGGVGKTSLVAHVAGEMAEQFERVLWRSLLNAPPLESLLAGLLPALAEQPLIELPTSPDEQLALLFGYLRQQRVLLVLDNLESILDPAEAGRFRPGYEGYDQLLWQAATSTHQSALLLTSRERPGAVARLAGDTPLVQSLLLKGLDEVAGQALLVERGVAGQAVARSALVARYSGNPLALKLVADTVQELFGGDVESFLAEETLIFDDVRKILAQQFDRLTELEQAILFWLAVEREAVDAQTLRRNLVQSPGHAFLEALRSLQNRSLIERQRDGLGLQNVVMEFLTEHLVAAACVEIQTRQPNLLHRHALIKSTASDEVRQSQIRLILAPVADRLRGALGQAALTEKLRAFLAGLRQTALHQPSYAGGNLLNLLLHQGVDVAGYDFSHLSVWQADLRGASLAGVNLTGADLTGTTITEDFGRIFAVAIHPHGHLLAAGGAQSAVRIWSFPAGQNAELLTGHTNAVMAVAWSPDGSLLASGSQDRRIRIWDWRAGRCLSVLPGHSSGVFAIAFSPDGRWLASAGQDHTVRLWEVATGRQLEVFTGHTDVVFALAFHPGGNLLASGGRDHVICLWELSALGQEESVQAAGSSVRLLATLRGHDHQVLSLAFSPAGSLLASGSGDSTIRLWEPEERRVLATLRGHNHWVRALVFSPDGARLFSGGGDRTIRIWEVAGRRALEVLRGHAHTIRAIALHPDGSLLASGGLDDTIRLWDLRHQQPNRAIRTIHGSVTVIRTLAFSPDGELLVTGDGKGWVRVWPVTPADSEPATPYTLPGRGMQVNCVTFSPDGRWIASADDDRVVRIWERSSRQPIAVLHGHQAAVHTVRFAPQGDVMATAGYEGAIYLWDVSAAAHPRLLTQLSGHRLEINDLHFTPDGSHLISGSSDSTLRVWNVATGRCVQVLEAEQGHCTSLALHAQRSLVAAAGWAGVIRLYRLTEQNQLEPLPVIKAHATRIAQLAFSPDGTRLASGGQSGTVRLWEVETGRQLLRLHGHTQPVEAVAFHPDGTLLASGSEDETMRLWTVAGEPPVGRAEKVLRVPGPYAGMKIDGVTGISAAQRAALKALGAADRGAV
ncbi:MAG: AAA family ATPase [Caldilineaceae bacterium]|nr:AAA family ATPase [Caldilineaceae bacterium]